MPPQQTNPTADENPHKILINNPLLTAYLAVLWQTPAAVLHTSRLTHRRGPMDIDTADRPQTPQHKTHLRSQFEAQDNLPRARNLARAIMDALSVIKPLASS